jgi:catechol 2,3-dioxygenase-like lactoylglutathione lyase family enzyme
LAKYYITGIQQVGIGVENADQAWKWYRQSFDMDIPVFEDEAEASLMTKYTGGKIFKRKAILAINMQGGGGFEIWQYLNRKPVSFDKNILAGDLGINNVKIKCKDIDAAYAHLLNLKRELVSDIVIDPAGKKHFYVKDFDGNTFEIIESNDWFSKNKDIFGGAAGCTIGVSDIDKSLKLYRDVLGYKEVVYDKTDCFSDIENSITEKQKYRRILLKYNGERKGAFCNLLGITEVELIQCYNRKPSKIFENRYWGDKGFIHVCFDVVHMEHLETNCIKEGFGFTVDSSKSFSMGQAAGRFAYVEDPDGTLIELVETHKIPIMKKLGWYLNVKKRNPEKPLPKWMLKALSLNRKK